MPYDDPDPTDPMTLHGVGVETDDERATVDMAQCFIQEFARLKFSADRLLRMFAHPGYAGPHLAYQQLGEERIRGLIHDEMNIRTVPKVDQDELIQVDASGAIALRVLD